MSVALLIAGVVGLLWVHELVVSRGPARTWARRLLLVGMLLAAAVVGETVSVRARLFAPLRRSAVVPMPLAFEPGGDPLLTRTARAQAPALPFPQTGTPEAVNAWRRSVLERVAALTGYPQTQQQVAFRVVSQEQVQGVRRSLITFAAEDGTRLPAFVLEPLEVQRRGAVLVVPGHGDGIRATAGLVTGDYQHAAALALARSGFVTLTPEVRGFGMLAPDGQPAHRAVAANALERGTSFKAVVVRDLGRALNVLGEWPGVDPKRIGVAGASLGGELAVLLAVLDPRVVAVASQSYGGATGPTGTGADVGDFARQTPHGCHTMPGINGILWQEDWFRLLAPRPVLVSRGRRNVPHEMAHFTEAVRGAFDVYGATSRFALEIEEGGHEFFVGTVIRFFEAHL